MITARDLLIAVSAFLAGAYVWNELQNKVRNLPNLQGFNGVSQNLQSVPNG